MQVGLEVLLAVIAGGVIGFLVTKFAKGEYKIGWSNKELDGTIFIIVICAAFLSMVYLTYRSPEFAELPSTQKILEIIKDISLIIVGYLFKKAGDSVIEAAGKNEVNK